MIRPILKRVMEFEDIAAHVLVIAGRAPCSVSNSASHERKSRGEGVKQIVLPGDSRFHHAPYRSWSRRLRVRRRAHYEYLMLRSLRQAR